MHLELSSSPFEMTVLLQSLSSRAVLPRNSGVRILKEAHLQTANRARNVFVLVPAAVLPDVSKFVSVLNRRHQLRALFIEDEMNLRLLPQLFERAGLRTLRNTLVHSGPSIPRRVLTAWLHGAHNQLIADATVIDEAIFVVSCALERYEVPFDKVPALKSIPQAERSTFEIDEDGSYIHWPDRDIHIDLDAIRATLDPEWRTKALSAKAARNQRYGAAIAELRTARGLTQSAIEGLSERQVRRIEKGEPTSSEALRRLAEAHGMQLSQYLNELARISTSTNLAI
jgi:hypothetical protein